MENLFLFEDRQDSDGKFFLQITPHVRSDEPVFWKRSGGFVSNGRERFWEYFIIFQNGWNGGGGLAGCVYSRWDLPTPFSPSEWCIREPFNWSYGQTLSALTAIEELARKNA